MNKLKMHPFNEKVEAMINILETKEVIDEHLKYLQPYITELGELEGTVHSQIDPILDMLIVSFRQYIGLDFGDISQLKINPRDFNPEEMLDQLIARTDDDIEISRRRLIFDLLTYLKNLQLTAWRLEKRCEVGGKFVVYFQNKNEELENKNKKLREKNKCLMEDTKKREKQLEKLELAQQKVMNVITESSQDNISITKEKKNPKEKPKKSSSPEQLL